MRQVSLVMRILAVLLLPLGYATAAYFALWFVLPGEGNPHYEARKVQRTGTATGTVFVATCFAYLIARKQQYVPNKYRPALWTVFVISIVIAVFVVSWAYAWNDLDRYPLPLTSSGRTFWNQDSP